MRSKIDIYNSALMLIGEKQLASPDDTSQAAVVCNQFYNQSVEQTLRLHQWNCALMRAELAPTSTSPVFGYEYAYNLPVDCITVVEMLDNEKYVIEGRQLLTDSDTCFIKYVKFITDPNLFDPAVTECLILMLAAKIAPILKDESRRYTESILNQLHKIALPYARMTDAYENNETPNPDSWLNY